VGGRGPIALLRWIDGGSGLLEGFGPGGRGFEEKAGEWIGRDPEEEEDQEDALVG